jgi:cytochrome c6
MAIQRVWKWLVLIEKMKKTFIILLFLGSWIITGCGSGTQKPNTETSTSTTTTPSNGADIYAGKCSACHGSDGNMGIGGAKKLPESVLSQEEREQIISGGKKTMPAFKDQLSVDDIKAVAAYTLTLK